MCVQSLCFKAQIITFSTWLTKTLLRVIQCPVVVSGYTVNICSDNSKTNHTSTPWSYHQDSMKEELSMQVKAVEKCRSGWVVEKKNLINPFLGNKKMIPPRQICQHLHSPEVFNVGLLLPNKEPISIRLYGTKIQTTSANPPNSNFIQSACGKRKALLLTNNVCDCVRHVVLVQKNTYCLCRDRRSASCCRGTRWGRTWLPAAVQTGRRPCSRRSGLSARRSGHTLWG